MQVWINGQFVPRDDAKVSAFDAGFQHAIGLFETIAARNGELIGARAHVDRLVDSARTLGLTERLHAEPLVEALHLALDRNEMVDARLRLTVTGGDLNMLQAKGQTVTDPTLVIVVQPPTQYPDAFFEKGVRVVIAEGRDNPLDPMAGHKTLNYWPRIRELQIAAAKQAAEAVWFTVSNHLSCTSVSNIFLVKDGALHTPIARGEEEAVAGAKRLALPSPVRPGVTRESIIDLATSRDIAVHRRMIDIDDLLGADEVFLTNSSWVVLPVTAVEAETIGDGAVGELTAELRQASLG